MRWMPPHAQLERLNHKVRNHLEVARIAGRDRVTEHQRRRSDQQIRQRDTRARSLQLPIDLSSRNEARISRRSLR